MGYGSGVATGCCVVCRFGSDLALLWLWHKPVAADSVRLLAQEFPYTTGAVEAGKEGRKEEEGRGEGRREEGRKTKKPASRESVFEVVQK